MIRQVITRTNTITGRHYYDEKAIMAWETGNELEDTNADFLHQTSAWIRKWAPHQLIVDGTYKKVNDFALSDPNVDIISNHYYTNANNNHPEQVRKDLAAIGGKKVYLVGEFGLLDQKDLNAIMQSIVHSEVNGAQAAGGFIWGFRGHRHDGGFYWHKEYTGHYSYHLPGFPDEGKANQEMEVVNLVRTAAAQMAGLSKAPALPVPEAPRLRESDSPFAINWMGSPVGRYYDVERAAQPQGPWTRVGKDISDGKNEWNPSKMSLFRDDYRSLTLGQTYYYRVIAKNESGQSAPSNVIRLSRRHPPVGGESSKTINVSVKPAVGSVPADYCSFGSGTLDVSKGTLTSTKSEKDTLAIGEDGFLGPFAHDGDSVSWQVSAPWDGKFTLHVKFNGKWGSKKN